MGCCESFARCLLIMFNLIFWLSGAGILGVGIWILVDKDLQDYLDVIKDAIGEDDLRNAAYILIGFGAFVFLVGFCGCCGAIRRSKCLLGFYILFLLIVCAGEMAVGIYVVIFKGDAEDKLDTGLEKSIKEHYGETLTTAWDFVQKELKCCGGNTPEEYQNSTWLASQTDATKKIPVSCCVLDAEGNPKDVSACQEMTGEYHLKGCKDELMSWIDDNAVIVIGVGFGIAALELLGLVCAICFCRHMDKDKYEQS